VNERHRQLDDAEAGAYVAACLRYNVNQPLPDFVGEILEFAAIEVPYIRRTLYGIK
jgi:hypothetical protein